MAEPLAPGHPSVVFNEDATRASILIPADAAGVTPESLVRLARERGIELDDQALATLEAIALDFAGEPRHLDRPFASSTPAQHGRDGGFELEAKLREDAAVRPTETDEPVNHYERRLYRRVARGEVIGTLTRPTQGRDGRDLTGRVLRARDGRPCPVHFDKELVIGPDGAVRSPCDGILSTDRKRLRVTPVFDVPASVDFSTGNIEFAGSVHVRGDVRDRFRLDIGENLIVDGVIEAASVRVKGGLHARTGMAARGLGRILVREDVEAGYLNAVSGAIEGSLTVHREVRNCTLTIGGDLHCHRGAVIGGSLSVSGGIDVGALGSPAGAHTTLKLGAVPFLDHSARTLMRRILALQAQRDAALPHIAALEHAPGTLSPTDQGRLSTLHERLDKIDAEANDANAELDRVRAINATGADVKLRIGTVIFPNVRLLVGNRIITFVNECKGPLHLGTDLQHRPVLRMGDGPMRPLDLYARSITVEYAPEPGSSAA